MTTLSAPATTIPGPRGGPFIGVLREVRHDTLGFLMRTFREYGDVASYRLGPLRSHLLSHPDAVKHVLQEHVRNYTKDHISYGMVRWVTGNGLLSSQGDFWLRQRRLAQPAFHRQRIAALGERMVQRAEELFPIWETAARTGATLDIRAEMMRLAMRIVGDALFGTDVRGMVERVDRGFSVISEQFITRFRTFNMLPPVLPTRFNRAWHAALAELDAVVYAIIAERRRDDTDRGDLLSLLMLSRDEETGAQMDDRQLRDEVLTMLIAGHETTATMLTWAWALLDAHPHVADRLAVEVDALNGRKPTMADLGQLSYTRMVLDETLRLYPPVYILARKVMEDDHVGGYRIPGGSAIDISPYVVQRHPDFWEEPERFDPERFLPERVAARHKYAYIPFSTGPRMCIGNTFALVESTLVLATLAQRFRPRLRDGQIPAATPLLTLQPTGGMPMRIALR